MSVLRRTLTGAAIAAAVAGLVALDTVVPHSLILWGVCLLLALGAAGEAAAMVARRGRAIRGALLAAVGAAFAVAILHEERGLWSLDGEIVRLAAPAAAAAVVAFALGRARVVAALLALWIAVPLVALVLWTREHGHDALAALIAVSKAGDVAGYFVGRRFGRRHPFPSLSPGKTVAGCVASLAAGVATGALLAGLWTLGPGGLVWTHGALAGLVLNLAAQAGDLLESAVKRRARVKDSGVLMGASGGVLDVLDSLLLTVPLAWLVLPALAAGAN
jgi:phosphatidate cytidylyltransferase